MYKLLVVDDEFNIRDGIANAIAWDKINVKIVGTAVDGKDALEKVQQLPPDIIIADVNMDNMDGLHLTEVLRQKYPFIKVIILSGYDEFEYVRRALELKVYSYVMKPVRSKELIKIVQSLITEIEEEKKLKQRISSLELEIDRNKPILVEKFLYDLLYGNIESRNEFLARMDFLGIRFSKTYYTCLVISIHAHHGNSPDSDIMKQQSFIFGVQEIVNKTLGEYEIRSLTGEFGSRIFIIGGNSTDEGKFHEHLTGCLERVVESISRLLDITVSVTIGGICSDPYKISRSFKEASLAFEHNAVIGEAGIIHINDVPNTVGIRYIYPADKEKILLKSFIDGNEKKYVPASKKYLMRWNPKTVQKTGCGLTYWGFWEYYPEKRWIWASICISCSAMV